jgi:hypothetical protein
MKRFFVVFDADYDGDEADVATWLSCALTYPGAPKSDVTVYDDLDKILIDREEKIGPFEDAMTPYPGPNAAMFATSWPWAYWLEWLNMTFAVVTPDWHEAAR